MDTILIASGNPHKVDEIRAVLGHLGLDCIGLDELNQAYPEPDETGGTFEANARQKALAYAAATGRPCLADDSGLVVDALDGRPGVFSARYFNDGAETDLPRADRDRLNNERVLRELEGVPDAERTARFVCTLCIAEPDGTVRCTVCGELEGRIGTPPRVPAGDHGFGYDPLFLVGPGFDRTSAELRPAEKNAISHRSKALAALSKRLSQL